MQSTEEMRALGQTVEPITFLAMLLDDRGALIEEIYNLRRAISLRDGLIQIEEAGCLAEATR